MIEMSKPFVNKPIPFTVWEFLNKIEFHEVKTPNYTKAGIETQIHINAVPNKLHDFLVWCDGERWNHNYQEETFKLECEKAMRSKREKPHFQMYINEMHCEVYPKQSYVSVFEVGLHYICQHSFDIFPSGFKGFFYAHDFDARVIGKLYPIKNPEPLIVKDSDIESGFMLYKGQIDEYDDNFVAWIRHRREIGNKWITKKHL